MYVDALTGSHADLGSVTAFVDTNEHRMSVYDGLASPGGGPAPRHYAPEALGEMFDAERPDAVIVTSPDHTHARYVTAALARGVDAICEKPLTTSVEGLRAIVDAAQAASSSSGAALVVTFNDRYSPRNSAIKEIISSGRIGKVTSVHFEWCLDTVHGADYFRRWHRNKANSGGLLVHKSTHHFDLVNWWLGDVPETVYARGGLRFYGAANAAERGLGPRPELSRDNPDRTDPFNLDLAGDEKLRRLYLEGEADDGYLRDRDVFAEGIDIEDNLSLVVGYRGGASMAYTLVAHSPWEGYRVAINGTEGRVEIEVVERSWVKPARPVIGHELELAEQEAAEGAAAAAAESAAAKPVLDPSAVHAGADSRAAARPFGTRIVLQRLWEPAEVVEVVEGAGGHGGGDGMLLDDVFRGPGDDPLHRQAGWADGVRSVLVGIAGNESLRTGQAVRLADFGLPLEESELDDEARRPQPGRTETGRTESGRAGAPAGAR